MERKTLKELTGEQDFNGLLFALSSQLVKTASLFDSALLLPSPCERTLKDTLSLLALSAAVPKSPNLAFLPFALSVFQSFTDLIELGVKRTRNIQRKVAPLLPTPHLPTSLPISSYPFRPSSYSPHTHQNVTFRMRFDLDISAATSLDRQVLLVEKNEQFDYMLAELSCAKEVAVDVQHCSQSYEGHTSLVQLSTRKQDFIVDVLVLWGRMKELRVVLGNPNIIKVMHGAEMDVQWLQRDFDLHIVGLFDTHRAARALTLPRLSYAFLLAHYCSVQTDKQYQLADWRIRPLPPAMLHYARLDTHFLLFIYDSMRNDLSRIGANAIQDTYLASHLITLIETRPFDFRTNPLYITLRTSLSPTKFAIIHGLFQTIDRLAQHHNNSFQRLAPRPLLTQLIARTKQLLLEKANPAHKIDLLATILTTKYAANPLLVLALRQYLATSFTPTPTPTPTPQPQPLPPQPIPTLPPTSLLLDYQPKRFALPLPPPTVFFEPLQAYLAAKYKLTILNDPNRLTPSHPNQPIAPMQVQPPQPQEEQEIIAFKRLNPNVVYAMEPVEQPRPSRPRKKVKEQEYQRRLRLKQGNVYELLEEE